MVGLDFAVVGPGRLGLHLVHRLTELGWRCRGIRGRTPIRHEGTGLYAPGIVSDTWDKPLISGAPTVFVTVPDSEIGPVAESLAESWPLDDTIVLHTSGLLTADVLEPCRHAGAAIGSWHPLQTFPPPAAGTVSWTGISCAVEGDPEAVERGFQTAGALGMRPWQIAPEHKPRYHAAAAVAANLTHILVVAANQLLRECGLQDAEESSPLEPLVIASTRSALGAHDFELLTGAIARGDTTTVARHVEVLPSAIAAAYNELSSWVQEQSKEPTVAIDRRSSLC